MLYDLLLRGGRVIDPAQSLDGAYDVAIREGRIAAVLPSIAPSSARETIDVSGKLVLPGLIDTHAHVFQYVTGRFGLEADLCGVRSGVTTLVDQGGPSCMTLPAFREFVVQAKKSRVVVFLSAAIRILREYERGIVFTLGRFTGVKGPGLIILIPFAQQMVKVDLRVVVQDVPPQDVITRDNVTVKVNAVLYFRIVDPERAIIKVADFMAATSQLAQTTLRSVLGKHELDELLAERDRLNADIQEILDQQTDAWGIKVTNVEIKHVDLNENMIRAIAKQAEAERLRRAKVINAEGEQQAAEKLVEAGRLLAREPQAMQLRYFAALHDIASERSSTIVFPLPTDLLTHLVPRPEGAK